MAADEQPAAKQMTATKKSRRQAPTFTASQNPIADNQTRLPRSAPDVVAPLPEGIKNLTFDGFPFVRIVEAMRWQLPRNTKGIEP